MASQNLQMKLDETVCVCVNGFAELRRMSQFWLVKHKILPKRHLRKFR